jgi:hypothetical protein
MKFTEKNVVTFFKDIFPKFAIEDDPKVNLELAKYTLSFEIIKKTTSADWIYNYLKRPEQPDKYLFHRKKGTDTDEDKKHRARLFLFAEMLYNLQHIPNIQNVFKKFGKEDFESTYIELEFAKYIFRSGRYFEFNISTGKKRSDYDILIDLNNENAAGEIKSKLESNEYKPKKLIQTIKDAKKQMPNNIQNFIFIKIPEEWGKNEDIIDSFCGEVKQYIDKSERIITVILLWNVWDFPINIDADYTLTIRTNEIRNIKSELENVKYPNNIFTAKVDLGEQEIWFDLLNLIKGQLSLSDV